MTNPFESHPLYRYRRLLLILSAASFVLCVFALADGSSQTYVLHIVAIALSTLLIIYDLVRFALGQTQDAAERPPWPVRKIMWGDAFLVLLFFFAFIGDSTGPYSYYSFPWYGYTSALSIFSMYVSSILSRKRNELRQGLGSSMPVASGRNIWPSRSCDGSDSFRNATQSTNVTRASRIMPYSTARHPRPHHQAIVPAPLKGEHPATRRRTLSNQSFPSLLHGSQPASGPSKPISSTTSKPPRNHPTSLPA